MSPRFDVHHCPLDQANLSILPIPELDNGPRALHPLLPIGPTSTASSASHRHVHLFASSLRAWVLALSDHAVQRKLRAAGHRAPESDAQTVPLGASPFAYARRIHLHTRSFI